MVFQGIPGAVHQRLIIEGDGAGLKAAVIDAHCLVDDLNLAACDRIVALIHVVHASSPPNKALRRDSSIVRISGTNVP